LTLDGHLSVSNANVEKGPITIETTHIDGFIDFVQAEKPPKPLCRASDLASVRLPYNMSLVNELAKYAQLRR
jgi:hypothetical protein